MIRKGWEGVVSLNLINNADPCFAESFSCVGNLIEGVETVPQSKDDVRMLPI